MTPRNLSEGPKAAEIFLVFIYPMYTSLIELAPISVVSIGFVSYSDHVY